MKLLGKKAIVTGANKSIGKAIAIAFAKEGADVVISFRSDKLGAKNTVHTIEQAGGTAACFFADFSTTEGVKLFFTQALAYLGRIDILVNNAGGYDTTNFLDLPIEKFESVLKVSLSAPMLLTQLAAQNMIQVSNSGVIINISAITGKRPYPNRVAHSTAKAGLDMLTQATALELAPYNIRVNALAPGATPYDDDVDQDSIDIPLKRMGKPSDHASAALFLASDESSWITGQIITVDGGQSLSFR